MNGIMQRIKRITLVNSIFLVLPSYILHYYLNVQVNSLLAVLGSVCLLIALHENHWSIGRGVLMLVLMLCGIGAIGSIFSGALSQLLMAISLSLSLVIASCGWSLISDQRTLNYLLIIGWILVGGAIFAFFYAISGGPPLAQIDLLGRDSYFYLTTFTNAVNGNLIRAAGIFDEPGALAMFVTLIVALNEAFQKNTKWSAALLFGGLVTGSFALLFIAVAYLFLKGQQKNLLLVAIIIAGLGGLAVFDERVSTLAEEFFLKRIEIVDGRLSGDNRTHQIESFFKIVDWDITLKGQKASGDDSTYIGYDQSSNPFSIYYRYGIFIWIPYVMLEVWLLYCFFYYQSHLRFSALALFMTLLQRPYIYNLHWGILISVVVVTIYRVQKTAVIGKKHIFQSNRLSINR